MKLNEVNDPAMKTRLELAKLKVELEERDKIIDEHGDAIFKLRREVAALQKTMTALIKKLGSRT